MGADKSQSMRANGTTELNKKTGKTSLFQPLPHRKKEQLTLGQRWADRITKWAGSWYFLFLFLLSLVIWMALNTYFVLVRVFDPYPFILLNLALSCIAAIQAPIILMSQNRQVERDRHRAEIDYYVNRRAEKEIKVLQRELLEIKSLISKTPRTKELKRIEGEIIQIQKEVEHSNHSKINKH